MQMSKALEGAFAAPGYCLSAVFFPETNNERVVFVEEPGITGKVLMEHTLDILVAIDPVHQSMPAEYTSRIGIHHKNRMSRRIEHDRIGRFRADPVHGQEFLSQFIRI
jgi:hypothetical protein